MNSSMSLDANKPYCPFKGRMWLSSMSISPHSVAVMSCGQKENAYTPGHGIMTTPGHGIIGRHAYLFTYLGIWIRAINERLTRMANIEDITTDVWEARLHSNLFHKRIDRQPNLACHVLDICQQEPVHMNVTLIPYVWMNANIM